MTICPSLSESLFCGYCPGMIINSSPFLFLRCPSSSDKLYGYSCYTTKKKREGEKDDGLDNLISAREILGRWMPPPTHLTNILKPCFGGYLWLQYWQVKGTFLKYSLFIGSLNKYLVCLYLPSTVHLEDMGVI